MANRIPSLKTILKWLIPGIGIKRWLIVMMAGVTILGLGFAMLIADYYRHQPPGSLLLTLTLYGWPLWIRAILAGAVGAGLIGLALIQINRSILRPLDVGDGPVIEAMLEHRRIQRGPKIVAVGGGTGLPTLLRGLKNSTANITAIVTVADDGGSSGRLRRDLGVLPPGDFRNNIAALARDEGMMTQLFQYRFGEGGLEGHSFGNLFISAMSGITGSFEKALVESSRVLNIRGQVLPSTLLDVKLMADLKPEPNGNRQRVAGESAIPEAEGVIDRVFLQPEDPAAYPEAVKAILSADLIVLGPGSLFTSILPNLLVGGIAQAIRASKALKVYVCNVATQRGETEGFSAADHAQAIERHVGPGLFDVMVVNDHFPPLAAEANYEYIRAGAADGDGALSGVRIRRAALVDAQRPWRHDADKLGKTIMAVLDNPGSG